MDRIDHFDAFERDRGAIFSPDRRYRYLLWRRFTPVNTNPLLIIGLNPSTADEQTDDPTIRRCVGFAMDLGYSSLWVANLFSFMATKPIDLRCAVEPIGVETDRWIEFISLRSKKVIVAWGNHGLWMDRGGQVLVKQKDPYVFGLTKLGAPLHPLYLKRGTVPRRLATLGS